MLYLTFEKYQEMGGPIPQEDFSILEKLAEKKLDYWTMDRIKDLDEIDEDIELCMFLIINKIDELKNNKNISSYTNDGISVSYNSTTEEAYANLYQQILEILPVELISLCIN